MARPLRFSVTAYQAETAQQWRETARRAEGLGYSTLFTVDHYLGPGPNANESGRSPVQVAPIAACMAAAAATTTLRVGCRVFCIDYHQPVVLAKELATLDVLSEGRLEVGLGAGWLAAEYESMGLHMQSPGVRIERLRQTALLMKAFWSGEQLDVVEDGVHAVGFAGRPLPVQQPHPPLLIGGGSPKVLRLAGAVADIASFNFNNSPGRIGPDSIATSSRAATADKVKWVEQGAGARFADIDLEIGAYFVAVGDDYRATADRVAAQFGTSADDIIDNPHALLGSVDEICDRVLKLQADFGVTYLNVPGRNMDEFAPVVARLAGT